MPTPSRQQQLEALYEQLTARLFALDRDESLALSEYDRAIHRERGALVAADRATVVNYLDALEQGQLLNPWPPALATINLQPTPTAPPPIDLDAALTLLATLPLGRLPPVSPLPLASRLPFSPNPLFVGREDDLRTLARILQAGATAAVGQVAAATGLGGIGKTQLAVEFAHRYGRFFAGGVFWLSCANPDAVAAEVVVCGLAMGLPAFETLDFPDQVRRVQQAWQESIPRLLIFDNCEEEAVLAQWRPATGGCRVLVTSRRAAWSAGLGVRLLALPVLPRADSVALLRRFRVDLAEGDPVLDEIAEELGDLPLALHLAGSFLARDRFDVTPTGYLEQLRRPDLLAHRSLVAGDWSPTQHETHVARTFALSYDRLDPEDPVDGLALALLARLACFAPGEPVARELLLLTVNAEPPKRNPTLKERLQRLVRPRLAVREQEIDKALAPEAIERLVMLGLVDEQADGGLVMHRLVAAFMGALVGAVETQGAVEEALGREAGRLNRTGLPALLLPWQGHLRHVTDRATVRGDLKAAWLCNQLGYHLYQAGDLPAAKPYLEQALVLTRQALGEAHPDTVASLNNLGMLLKDMGDLPAAKSYLEQALAIRRQALGETHPDTATSLNNLGLLLQAMGDLPAAKGYLEQALAILRQALGEAHPHTATSFDNVGLLLEAMGDLPAAKPYLEQALAIRRLALVEAHPDTATSLNNLGMLLKDMGDLPAAKSYLEQALVLTRQALGEAHPHTATSLNNVGMVLQDMGDLLVAKAYYEQALAIRRQVLGEAHPDTATSLNNLGTLLYAMGDLPAAKPYLEQALAILRQALGEAHPNTAASLNNLGLLLQAMGDLPAAKGCLEQAVAILERSLGPEHPNTQAGRRSLEVLLDEFGTGVTSS